MFFFVNDTPTTEIYTYLHTLSLHDALPISAAKLGVNEVQLQLATLGKALGGYGAAVVGDADLIEHLAETARPYIYTTALPPAQAAATLAAVDRKSTRLNSSH